MIDDYKLEKDILDHEINSDNQLWLMIEDHEIKSDDFVVDDYKLETDIEDHEIEIIIL